MKQWCLFAVLSAWLLSGCAQSPATSSNTLPLLPMAVPLQPNGQYELAIMRIDHLLQRRELSNNDKAELYYERGLINDNLGLRDTARYDFDRSLMLNPAQPELFNTLGVHYTQNAMYDSAYESFDSALELNEQHQSATLNRGIALYYGGRFSLAQRDLLEHYEKDIQDPYRAIWLYFVELEQDGEVLAQQKLRERYKASNKESSGWQIAQLYLNDISEQDLLVQIQKNSISNQQLAEQLCEAYFYLAKRYQYNGNDGLAVALYKLAMSNNVYDFIEHRYSLLELSRMAERLQSEHS